MNESEARRLFDEAMDRMNALGRILPTPPAPSKLPIIRIKPGDKVGAAFMQCQREGGGIVTGPPGKYRDTLKGIPRAADSPMVILTTDNSVDLPKPGQHVTREHLPGLAEFTTPNLGGGTYEGQPGSANIRFEAIAFGPAPDVNATLISLAGDESVVKTVDQLPINIALDRVLGYGQKHRGQRRGLLAHGRKTTVQGCAFYDFCQAGRDSQAINAYNGGDGLIENSILEASAENLLFGGGNSASEELNPHDWTVRYNLIRKDPDWLNWPGGKAAMNTKALIEFKNCDRAEVYGNLLEHAWADDWSGGVAFAYKCANASRSPWTVTRGIYTHHNIARDVDVLVALVGWGDDWKKEAPTEKLTQRMSDMRFEHILGYGIRQYAFRVANPPDGLLIDHITAIGMTGSFFDFWFHGNQPKGSELAFTNSAVYEGTYGIKMQSAPGTGGYPALALGFDVARLADNIIGGTDPAKRYPGNVKMDPAALRAAMDAEFQIGADVTMTAGVRPGADVSAIKAAMAGKTWTAP